MEPIDDDFSDYSGPFGNPDGTLEDFTVRGRFIDFSSEGTGTGIAMRDNNLRKRIIFGRKGSGKTLYMRRQKAWAEKQEDLFVFDQKSDLPTTEVVQKISVLFDSETKTNQWMQIWRRSVLIAIASLFYCKNADLSDLVKRHDPSLTYAPPEFRKIFAPIFAFAEAPETIYSVLNTIFAKYPRKNELSEYLINPQWNSFENVIFRDVQNAPPIVMYIDAIDEEFRHSPVVWMDCQKGLFYAVIRLMRDMESKRLHATICARDIVYSSISESEHFTRYVTDDHISVLDWSKRTTERFLRTKVDRLPDGVFVNKRLDKTLEGWLGMTKIKNKERDIVENVCDYLLRHTRMLPRDIVVLGNLLSHQMETCRTEKIPFNDGRLRKTISEAAKVFARETISQCANHFCSAGRSRRDLNRAFFMRDEEIELSADEAATAIRALIKKIGKDVFSRDELYQSMTELGLMDNEAGRDGTFIRYRIDSILWQNAAIAYRHSDGGGQKWMFNWSSVVEKLTLPAAEQYGFHSVFIDECGIAISSPLPVY